MQKAGFVFFASFVFVTMAAAQVPTRGNVFFGYSYSNENTFTFAGGNRVNLGGWEGSFEGRVLPWVGVVADVDRRSGSVCPATVSPPCGPSGVNIDQADVLFGPRLSMSVGKLRPFVEGLFGFEHVNTRALGPDRSFATALGGGLDYKLARPLAWRFQGDYMRTKLFNTTQNNMRLTTGIVFRF